MKNVFETSDKDFSVTVRKSYGVADHIALVIYDKRREEPILAVMPNATGTELALAVLEAMGAPEGSPEGVAAGYLRNALAERQRDQKLEALALELVNAYPNVVWEELSTTGKTWWLQVAAKALELGASVDN